MKLVVESRLHWNVTSASVSVNANEAVAPVVDGGVGSNVGTGGGDRSTVHVRVVAALVLPASVARTSNVCWPVANPEKVFGDVHVSYGSESRRH